MKRPIFTATIIALTMMIFAVSYYGIVTLPVQTVENVPTGSISNVDPVSSKEIHLTIGELTDSIDYDKCHIVVISPEICEICSFDLENGIVNYSAPDGRVTLSTLTIIDQANNGEIDNGDVISLNQITGLICGGWELKILYGERMSCSLDGIFIVPNFDDAPYGSFHSTSIESPSKAVISFGLTSTAVPFYYTSIVILPPDDNMSGRSWAIEKNDSYEFSYNETIRAYIIDADREDIADYNDVIVVESVHGTLATGTWKIMVMYNFTGDVICLTTFEVE